MKDLQELLLIAKGGDVSCTWGESNFSDVLTLVELADAQGLLKSVTRVLRRTDDLCNICIAIELKGGLSVGGEMWLEQYALDAK